MATRSIEDIIERVTVYAESEVRGKAKEYDENEQFPQETFDYLADLGVLRIPFNRQYGGLEGTFSDSLKVAQVVSRECTSTGSVLLTQISFGITPIHQYGTEEQKQRYLPALLSGEILGAFAMNELDAGSDFKKMETIAVEKDTHWELNGSKNYISHAGKAGIYSVVSRTLSLDGEEGYGIFLVEAGMAGFTVGPQEEKMGIRGMPVASLGFDQVEIPKNLVLGGSPGGIEQCCAIKDYNKLFVSAQSIGIAEGVFERALTYMQKDRRFGQRLIDLPTNQHKMADAYTEICAAKALLGQVNEYRAEEARTYAMIKLKASSVAVETAELAMQLTGGYGYMRDNDIERFVRDAQLTRIYGGGSDAQRCIVSQPWIATNKRRNEE
ncbi:butyryl-CoA dehydrogenase [Desemzia incerta]|uniref:Butyryl-CoA dehydrogenase n=1 Tax=Desemzia incerta TaxID=82801 RepID=A0A1I5XZH8_9LACT|nr:acyl-CoA dehydrogenase family protein [Desemzia incerta]SFQ37412.1 butyryl-CoA dehydrogenase [Desemzia incerta]